MVKSMSDETLHMALPMVLKQHFLALLVAEYLTVVLLDNLTGVTGV